MAFIAMLAFQVAGALVLLLNNINGNREAVIRSCFPGSNIVERDDDNNCLISYEKLQKSAHAIYLNIAAFCDLVVGYGIAAFSPSLAHTRWITAILVFVSAATLTWAEFCICKKIAQKVYSEDRKIAYSELERYGVDTYTTEKEVDDMLNEVYGEDEENG